MMKGSSHLFICEKRGAQKMLEHGCTRKGKLTRDDIDKNYDSGEDGDSNDVDDVIR